MNYCCYSRMHAVKHLNKFEAKIQTVAHCLIEVVVTQNKNHSQTPYQLLSLTYHLLPSFSVKTERHDRNIEKVLNHSAMCNVHLDTHTVWDLLLLHSLIWRVLEHPLHMHYQFQSTYQFHLPLTE